MNRALKRLGLTLSLAMLAAAPLGAAPLRASAHAAAWQTYDRETVVDTSTGESYIIFGNVRHLVSSPQVLSTLGISYGSATRVSDSDLASLPQGDPLTMHMVNGQVSPLSPIAAGSATLALSASTISRGEYFTVTGAGYAANESVEVTFDFGLATHWLHADGTGQFSTGFSVPDNTALGTLRLYAYGSTSKILEVEPLRVTTQTVPMHLSVEQQTVRPGATAVVSGMGFWANEQVSLAFIAGGAPVLVTASPSGDFNQVSVPVPPAITPGLQNIRAIGQSSNRHVDVVVTVLAQATTSPRIVVNTGLLKSGNNLVVSGKGFAGDETVQIRFNNTLLATTTTDAFGGFSQNLGSVANGLQTGTYTVQVYGFISRRTVTTSISVAGSSVAAPLPDGALIRASNDIKVYLIWHGVRHWITDTNAFAALGFKFGTTPVQTVSSQAVAALPEGSSISVRMAGSQVSPVSPLQSGSGYVWLSQPSGAPGGALQLSGSNYGHYEHVAISFAGNNTTVQTDQNGNFSAALTIPGSATTGSILDIYIYGQSSTLFNVEPVSVISPTSPVQATAQAGTFQQGQNGQVTASGFAPNERVQIFLAQNATVLTVTADSNGNVTATVPVPASLSAGSQSLVLYGTTSKRAASIQVTILPASTSATLTLSQQSVTPGSQILLTGSGYHAGELITIRINGQSVQTITADGNGRFSNAAVTVPLSLGAGAYSVSATGNSSGMAATTQLTVTAFTTKLQLAGGVQVAGGTLSLTGQGFANGEVVTFTLDGQSITTNPATVNASTNGAFSASLTLSATLSPGTHALVATGASSHASASLTLQVQAQSAPPPPPSPSSHVWYFPRGDTHSNYRTLYYLTNYQAFSVQVNFTFMLGNYSPTSYSLWVPAHGRTSLDPRNVVGPYHDVFAVAAAQYSIRVQEVVAHYNRDTYWTYGVAGPRLTWYYGGGNSSYGHNETLILANPSGQPTTIRIQFRTQEGRYIYHNLSLVPNGFLTLNMASYFPDVPRGHHTIYFHTLNDVPFIAQDVL
jgi:hypothetical protein